MVQYVIDCLSHNTAPPWLESADPAVSLTFAGGEKAHSETRIWLPLPGTRHERFAVHIVPSEVTPIFFGSGHASRIWPGEKCGFSALLQYEVAVSDSCDSAPIGTLALALTPSGSFETTGETTTLVEETAADMTAAVQEDLLEKGQRSIVASVESNDGDTKQVPRLPGSLIRDLIAAARQMDETMVSAFTAACSFQRFDLALVNPGTVQTILVNDVTAAGSTAEEWSYGELTKCAWCRETQRLDHDEESTNRMVLLSDRKRHAVRKLSSHSSSVSLSSSVQGTLHPASHVQSCSRHGIPWSM